MVVGKEDAARLLCESFEYASRRLGALKAEERLRWWPSWTRRQDIRTLEARVVELRAAVTALVIGAARNAAKEGGSER